MRSKTMKRYALIVAAGLILIFIGLCIGRYSGYLQGYQHGRKVTNAWWIDKQSRYYDSIEIEEQRRSKALDRI
ncbi:MAG: hypothetical protein P8X96_00990 [Desulfobacteraceae bacterium]